jgi:hypothetical protein
VTAIVRPPSGIAKEGTGKARRRRGTRSKGQGVIEH